MPNRHKLALLTMLGAYPTIVSLLAVLKPILGSTPMPIQAAVLVPLMVLALTYVVMPLLTRVFANWLRDEATPSHRLLAAALIPSGFLVAERPAKMVKP